MSIRVVPGLRREIAETLGRYFEARGMPFHVEERPAGVLHVGFRADGHPAAITVTFDEDAFAAFEQWDAAAARAGAPRNGIRRDDGAAQPDRLRGGFPYQPVLTVCRGKRHACIREHGACPVSPVARAGFAARL